MTVSRCGRSNTLVLLSAVAGALGLPAVSWAGSGGGALGPSSSSKPSTTAPRSNTTVQPGNLTGFASGGGMTLRGRSSTLLRNQLQFSGTVPARDAGALVQIERMGHETGWGWAVTAQARVGSGGSFSATWTTNHIGRFAIRAVVAAAASGARAADASATVTVTVYRPSIATQYGPGFWGNETACGEVLRPRTLGVANRTLPCGTAVAIYYHGRTIVVPVIDRGPYANNADWDLTQATAQALGMGGTETIGAVSLPPAPG